MLHRLSGRSLALIIGALLLPGIVPPATASPLQYPELMVVPRASKILARDVRNESQDGMTRYMPSQVPALALMLVGMRAMNHTENDAPSDTGVYGQGAVALGAMMLGGTTLLGMMHTPYKDGLKAIKKVKTPGNRGQLEKERLAEEALSDAASLARRIGWVTFFLSAGLSSAIAGSTEDPYIRIAAGVGALTSISPLLFSTAMEDNACNYQRYRKRIYGPLSRVSGGLGIAPDGRPAPLLSWQLRW